MKRTFFSAMAAFAVFITANQLAFSQVSVAPVSNKDTKRIEKVKRDLEDIGVGNTITVSRIDNRDFFGRVKSIGAADFEVVETDSKVTQIFKYVDIKNVRSGDGQIMAMGTRKNRRHRWIIPIVFVGGLIALTAIGLKER
ncbi:MAG: hypothetical protein ABL999_15915 [Pyrinomonadaceae bacterium]